jgi:hypothetical protein
VEDGLERKEDRDVVDTSPNVSLATLCLATRHPVSPSRDRKLTSSRSLSRFSFETLGLKQEIIKGLQSLSLKRPRKLLQQLLPRLLDNAETIVKGLSGSRKRRLSTPPSFRRCVLLSALLHRALTETLALSRRSTNPRPNLRPSSSSLVVDPTGAPRLPS